MKNFKTLLAALILVLGSFQFPAMASDNGSLFVNMTTDDPHRANMAISFGGNQFSRGHPLTIFLNDKGVLVAARSNTSRYADQQKALGDLLTKGATVLICGMCMKHYGVAQSDLLPGIKVGSPEMTGAALFKDGARTLTW
jgi:sulfur relay (sulfurtransferase) complex TusBCD TusD component (DsrE family)